MFFKFLPKDFNFFELFEKQAGFAIDAARLYKETVSKGGVDEETLKKIQDIEHQADDTAHGIIDQLNKTFITPFDREDIYSLAKELDDVIDMINTIMSRLKVYKLNGKNSNLIEFARVTEESVVCVSSAVKALRHVKHSKSLVEACVEIHRLENVGDSLRDKALGEIFEKEKDPIAVIKWKEIYQDAETVLDICEDVAHVVSSILVKQA